MKVQVLGAAQEVGRSGFLVNAGEKSILLDYGVAFGRRGDPPLYPEHIKPKDIDSVIITHAHLDHCGYVPSLFMSGNTSVYATPPTFDLSHLLIEDMLKIQRDYHPFGIPELNNMMSNAKKIGYKQRVDFGDSGTPASFELRESGHVIGGSTVLIESEGKRIFYTGDVNIKGSRMLREADLDIGDIDLLITESTYSQTEQMPRAESERGLVDFAEEIMDRKGVLFIPSFSVERSQEIACVLKNANFSHKVIMDGMALKVNNIMFKHPDYLRDYKVFSEAINGSIPIKDHNQRIKELEEPCVVISPAGMLVGGNAVFYLQHLGFDDRNGIALVSYQGEGTPGRKLLETGKISTRGKEMKVQAQVKQFEFSGHSDRNELFDMVKRIKGDPKVLTVHGDNESCTKFAQEINERFGLEAHPPQLNEIVTV